MRSLRPSLLVAALLLLPVHSAPGQPAPRQPGELAWAIHYDPKTFDPAKVDEQASELVRYLTGGVLVRVNRQTQEPEPELAQSFRVSRDGLFLTFKLRDGLRFSDGAPLTSADAAWSLRRVLSPATNAVVAQEFLAPEKVSIDTPDSLTLRVHLSKAVVGVAALFDEIAIASPAIPTTGVATAPAGNCPSRPPSASTSRTIASRRSPSSSAANTTSSTTSPPTTSPPSPAACPRPSTTWAPPSAPSSYGSTRLPPPRCPALKKPGSGASPSASPSPRPSTAPTLPASPTAGTPHPPTASFRPPTASGSTAISTFRTKAPPKPLPGWPPPASIAPAPISTTQAGTPSASPSSPTPATPPAPKWPP